MRKLTVACLMALGMICMTPLSSCSSFFDGEESLMISEITHTVQDDGSIVIVITYTDEDITPLTFTIPAGMSGKDGVGIKEVTADLLSDNSTLLTIYYTNDSMEPTQITVPSGRSGTDGRGISDVVIGRDEVGNTTIQFAYTDGTTSDVMTVTNGNDGVGINDISYALTEDGKQTVVTFTLSDGNTKTVTLQNGSDGKEISSIYWDKSNSDQDSYAIVITYSDDTSSTLVLERPRATVWMNGSGTPGENPSVVSDARDGDYYFDTKSGNVYTKNGSSWVIVFKFTGTGANVSFNVTFYPNGGTFYVQNQAMSLSSYVVETNGNYMSDSQFPTVRKDGSTFAGWYTSADSSNVNAGQLTTLTFINQDITVYARWTTQSVNL